MRSRWRFGGSVGDAIGRFIGGADRFRSSQFVASQVGVLEYVAQVMAERDYWREKVADLQAELQKVQAG